MKAWIAMSVGVESAPGGMVTVSTPSAEVTEPPAASTSLREGGPMGPPSVVEDPLQAVTEASKPTANAR